MQNVLRRIRTPLGRLQFPPGYEPTPIERIATVSEGTCLPILNDIVIPNLSDTPPKYKGTGVVTCAGGKYLKMAYASISKLRQVNADIPVQIWCLNEQEVEGHEHKFDGLGVEFRSCEPFFELEHYHKREGWPSKSIAIKHSPFQHCLFLDADCYPLIDPVKIFEHKDYNEGLLMFPDGKQCRNSNAIFNMLGISYSPDFWEWEAGQFLIDKVAHWKSVQLYSWFNRHAYLFYFSLHGEKDLLPLAATKLREPFVTSIRPDWVDAGFIHKLTDGTPAFHHWLSPKRDLVDLPQGIQQFFDEYDLS